MPVITLELAEVTDEQRRELIEKTTELVSEITKIPKSGFIVMIKENKLENVGVGGRWLPDIEKERESK